MLNVIKVFGRYIGEFIMLYRLKRYLPLYAVLVCIMRIHAEEDDESPLLLEHSFQFSPALYAADIVNVVINANNETGINIPYQILGDIEYRYIPHPYFGFSLVSQFGIGLTTGAGDQSGGSDITGGMFGISPGILVMPFGTKTRGIYAAFYPSLIYNTSTLEDNKQQSMEFGLGVSLGYQWRWDGGFTMSAGFGAGVSYIREFNESATRMVSSMQELISELVIAVIGKPLLEKPFEFNMQAYFRIGYAFGGFRD
jgi:hypothetical protein